MIQLYQFKTSPFTEKVRRAMNYKGIAFDVVEVERAAVPEGKYADVSPTGKFPCIMDAKQAVWDSTDIIHHLEAKNTDKPLVPADARDAALVDSGFGKLFTDHMVVVRYDEDKGGWYEAKCARTHASYASWDVIVESSVVFHVSSSEDDAFAPTHF